MIIDHLRSSAKDSHKLNLSKFAEKIFSFNCFGGKCRVNCVFVKPLLFKYVNVYYYLFNYLLFPYLLRKKKLFPQTLNQFYNHQNQSKIRNSVQNLASMTSLRRFFVEYIQNLDLSKFAKNSFSFFLKNSSLVSSSILLNSPCHDRHGYLVFHSSSVYFCKASLY